MEELTSNIIKYEGLEFTEVDQTVKHLSQDDFKGLIDGEYRITNYKAVVSLDGQNTSKSFKKSSLLDNILFR